MSTTTPGYEYLESTAFRVSTYFFGTGFITGFFTALAFIAGVPVGVCFGVGAFAAAAILIGFLIMGSMRLFSSPEDATVKAFRHQLDAEDFVEQCKNNSL